MKNAMDNFEIPRETIEEARDILLAEWRNRGHFAAFQSKFRDEAIDIICEEREAEIMELAWDLFHGSPEDFGVDLCNCSDPECPCGGTKKYSRGYAGIR